MDGVSAGNVRPNHWRSGIREYARLYVDEGRGMGQKRRRLVTRERRHVARSGPFANPDYFHFLTVPAGGI